MQNQEHAELKKALIDKGLKIICEICLSCEHPNGTKEGCSTGIHAGYEYGWDKCREDMIGMNRGVEKQ